jgi:thymidylate synthase
MKFVANSIDDLLIDVYTHIIEDGKDNHATKGKNIEVLGCEMVLTNPIARISRSESRGLIFSCLGEFFWYLSGSNDVEPIKYYIPRYRNYCESDGKVHGGYGKRLFNMHDKYNQIERIINQLKCSSSTRKAVIQLFDSSDLCESYKDIPCTLNLQFILREGKLDMFTMMRSNDAFMGLPHDIFVFTMLLELIASELDCEIGTYHHYVVSLHLYEDSIEKAKDFINEGYMLEKSIMDPMPKRSYSNDLETILNYEKIIRSDEKVDCSKINISPYWKDILNLLIFFNQTKKNDIANLRSALQTKQKISNKKYRSLIDKRTRTH